MPPLNLLPRGRARRPGPWLSAVFALILAACSRHADPAAGAARPTPSGQPVPRYVSLKFDKVNARAGPADDSRLLWVYHARGLPLQVVAETDEWRRVCDPTGAVAWLHRRTVAERRTAMNPSPQGLALRRRPSEAAEAAAVLVGHAVAELRSCRDGWCEVSVGHTRGWAPATALWGADERLQCR